MQDQHHPLHTSDFERAMADDMAAMMSAMHATPMTGDADRDFLAMMIVHHRGAIDMALRVLEHGRDPLTRALAHDIVATQSVEIASMTARHDALGRGISEPPYLGATRGG